jgi:hypothetical protein
MEGNADLFLIVEAFDGVCFLFRFGNGRQEEPAEDGDDSDDHEQLDESEGGGRGY